MGRYNHPFDRWTQDDYYNWVSFFTGLQRKLGVEPREFYIYNNPAAAPARHIVDDRPMPATVLGGEAPVPKGGDPRKALAAWLHLAEERALHPQPRQPHLGALHGPGVGGAAG